LPIDIPDRNVFVSYNFEFNYAVPTKSTDFTQGVYDKILFITGVDEEAETDDDLKFEARDDGNSFSRSTVYRMIEERMEKYGINGEKCLLRLICEVAGSELVERNGVFGNLFHILFR
jgi:hypothetical protein